MLTLFEKLQKEAIPWKGPGSVWSWRAKYHGNRPYAPRSMPPASPAPLSFPNVTSCSGLRTGRLRSITWLMRVKMAVLPPMPRASDRSAMAVNAGLKSQSLQDEHLQGSLPPTRRAAPFWEWKSVTRVPIRLG
jgi:hypothetical protein